MRTCCCSASKSKGKSYGKCGTEAVPSHQQPLLYNTSLIPGLAHAQPHSPPLGAATPSSARAGSSVPQPREVVWGGCSGSVLHFPIICLVCASRDRRDRAVHVSKGWPHPAPCCKVVCKFSFSTTFWLGYTIGPPTLK